MIVDDVSLRMFVKFCSQIKIVQIGRLDLFHDNIQYIFVNEIVYMFLYFCTFSS